MSHPLQLLIVGAGPTGLALATLCQRLGIGLRIIDQRAHEAPRSKAMGLSYRASELLACMGLHDRFDAYPDAVHTVTIHAKRRPMPIALTPTHAGSGAGAFTPRAIRVPQGELEDILIETVEARGKAVEWGVQLVGFAQSGDGLSAHLRKADGNEEIVHCSWLVSCEGARGLASQICRIRFESASYLPMAFLIADVELRCELSRDTHHLWTHPDGLLAALPAEAPHGWRLFADVTQHAADLPIDISCGVLTELVRYRTRDARTKVIALHRVLPLNVDYRVAERFRHDRVLLAGDAAHFHSPTGGQGITLGLQDAANLAWKLGRVLNGAPARLLDTYDDERRRHARDVLDEVQRTLMLFAAPDWSLRTLRDFVTLPGLRRPGLQQRMFEPFTHLRANYRASRLSRHQDHRPLAQTSVHAGDRAPDFVLRGARGEATSLFHLLSAGKPVALIGPAESSCGDGLLDRLFQLLEHADIDAVLVASESEPCWHAHERCLIDVQGELERLYGLQSPCLCLIRPDDHIGLIQIPIDEAALREYLAELCASHKIEPAAQSLSRRWTALISNADTKTTR